jgi:hypothetical protein
LNNDGSQKVLKKVRRESVAQKPKLENDLDDTVSHRVQTRQKKTRERYFNQDSDGEIDIPDCNIPARSEMPGMGARSEMPMGTRGSTFDINDERAAKD